MLKGDWECRSSLYRRSFSRKSDRPLLCRFSDACMTKPSTRANSRRPKSAGARNRGVQGTAGQQLISGYGDLKGTPVAGSAQHSGASGQFRSFGRRTSRATAAGKQPAGVHGGDFEPPQGLPRRAPAWPGQAQRQSRPVLRFGNGDDGVMTCRSRLAPQPERRIGAWSHGRRPR